MTKGGALRLCVATAGDARRVFVWRNDPQIVALSTTSRPVSWADHIDWFRRQIDGLDRQLYIIESAIGEGMGVVRYEPAEESRQRAVVTIYLLGQFTGRGHGIDVMHELAARAFAENPDLQSLHAEILPENTPSLKSFGRAGYLPCPPGERVTGEAYPRTVEMILRRADWNG